MFAWALKLTGSGGKRKYKSLDLSTSKPMAMQTLKVTLDLPKLDLQSFHSVISTRKNCVLQILQRDILGMYKEWSYLMQWGSYIGLVTYIEKDYNECIQLPRKTNSPVRFKLINPCSDNFPNVWSSKKFHTWKGHLALVTSVPMQLLRNWNWSLCNHSIRVSNKIFTTSDE